MNAATNLTLFNSPVLAGDDALRATAFSAFSYGNAIVLIALGVFTVLVFLAGFFLGAAIQRRVASGLPVKLSWPSKKEPPVESDEPQSYTHPNREVTL